MAFQKHMSGGYTSDEQGAITDAYMGKALDRIWLNKGFGSNELEAWGDLGDELIWRMCLHLKRQDDDIQRRKRQEQTDLFMAFFDVVRGTVKAKSGITEPFN